MKDERSRKAVDTAIAFGQGKATREELDHAAAAYAAAARIKNQQQTADIVRKTIKPNFL